MVSFSTTGLLLHVALFPPGTTHDCAIGQAGPSIWSRLPPAIPQRGPDAADRARGRACSQPHFAPLAAPAQQPGKVWRIGLLMSPSVSSERARIEAFRQGLGDLGYAEGRNIVIEYRYADGNAERLPTLADELVRLKVDLIVTAGDFGIRAAKEATTTIPIVVALAGDLVGPGHVASVARPGGNITGLTTGPVLSQKRLELLKTAFPKVARVALFWNPGNAVNVTNLKETEAAAKALGVRVLALEVRRAEDFERAFQDALRDRADAVLGIGDTVLLFHRALIVSFAARSWTKSSKARSPPTSLSSNPPNSSSSSTSRRRRRSA